MIDLQGSIRDLQEVFRDHLSGGRHRGFRGNASLTASSSIRPPDPEITQPTLVGRVARDGGGLRPQGFRPESALRPLRGVPEADPARSVAMVSEAYSGACGGGLTNVFVFSDIKSSEQLDCGGVKASEEKCQGPQDHHMPWLMDKARQTHQNHRRPRTQG